MLHSTVKGLMFCSDNCLILPQHAGYLLSRNEKNTLGGNLTDYTVHTPERLAGENRSQVH